MFKDFGNHKGINSEINSKLPTPLWCILTLCSKKHQNGALMSSLLGANATK